MISRRGSVFWLKLLGSRLHAEIVEPLDAADYRLESGRDGWLGDVRKMPPPAGLVAMELGGECFFYVTGGSAERNRVTPASYATDTEILPGEPVGDFGDILLADAEAVGVFFRS